MILTIFAVIVAVAILIAGLINESRTICGMGHLALVIALMIISCPVVSIVGVLVQHDVDYQNKLYEREVLEYRIEHIEDDFTGNELIYKDVVTFNNELRETKKWARSPFTNWFYNQDIASLDYVELPTD